MHARREKVLMDKYSGNAAAGIELDVHTLYYDDTKAISFTLSTQRREGSQKNEVGVHDGKRNELFSSL